MKTQVMSMCAMPGGRAHKDGAGTNTHTQPKRLPRACHSGEQAETCKELLARAENVHLQHILHSADVFQVLLSCKETSQEFLMGADGLSSISYHWLSKMH